MKKLILLIGIVLFLAFHIRTSAEIIFVQKDTLINKDTVIVTPYLGKTSVRSLANFAFVKKDHLAFQIYSGQSVLNTLRGHIPNLNISPNPTYVTPGLRNASSMLVIDGLPYAWNFQESYNMNTFEYENIYVLSSGNAALQYGSMASSGAVFLQSKTGRNIVKPFVEFNSFPTMIFPGGSSSEQWLFTNAISYAQDFGMVDSRISYNGTFGPNGSSQPAFRTGLHNLKINTGFDFTDRFNARIILDGMSRRSRSTSNYTFFNGQPLQSESESAAENVMANLVLRYQVLKGLAITSQSSLGKIDTGNDSRSNTSTQHNSRENQRSFVNLFVSGNQSLGRDLVVKEFAGLQYERQDYIKKARMYSASGSSNEMYQYGEYQTKSLLAGAGVQYKDFWFADVNYRTDNSSAFSAGNEGPTYAMGTVFVFSDAFRLKNSWFSSGRLRMSYGKTSFMFQEGFPSNPDLNYPGNVIPNPGLLPTKRKMFEAGTDLSFINNKLNLSLSYFRDINEETITKMALPSWIGYAYVYVNFGELHAKGWEVILSADIVKRNYFSWNTDLTWSTFKNYFESDNPPSTSNPPSTILGNPLPDWRGSLLNQFIIGNCFFTFLTDVTKGGDIITSTSSPGGNPFLKISDGSNIKLRDVSLGYVWRGNQNNQIIESAKVSLSARNLWTVYSRHTDAEAGTNATVISPQKSASMSLTLIF